MDVGGRPKATRACRCSLLAARMVIPQPSDGGRKPRRDGTCAPRYLPQHGMAPPPRTQQPPLPTSCPPSHLSHVQPFQNNPHTPHPCLSPFPHNPTVRIRDPQKDKRSSRVIGTLDALHPWRGFVCRRRGYVCGWVSLNILLGPRVWLFSPAFCFGGLF